MVRQFKEHGDHIIGRVGSVPLAIGLFVAVSLFVALCAKHALRRVLQKRHGNQTSELQSNNAPSPILSSPKKLVTSISNKAVPLVTKRKDGECDDKSQSRAKEDGGGFGEGGLWQKSILMGEKCHPPEFSGAIYYDSHGKQVSELPRSPRASPLPSITFPVVQDAK